LIGRLIGQLIGRLIDTFDRFIDKSLNQSIHGSTPTDPALPLPPTTNRTHVARYSYTGLVTSAKNKTSASTYVDLLGLTMITQLASVFWDGAWLLLLLVRRAVMIRIRNQSISQSTNRMHAISPFPLY
jgi:hypothetical protein